MSTTTVRQTADERREAVLEAAAREFARKGLHGASTDAIAKEAGISQPYLFRLFGTKKELYLATTARRMEETYQVFERASRGKSGIEALEAMGEAYTGLIENRERLQLMLQCFAGCDDPDVRAGVRRVWSDLVELAERSLGRVAGGDQRLLRQGDAAERDERHAALRRSDSVGRPADRRLPLRVRSFFSNRMKVISY